MRTQIDDIAWEDDVKLRYDKLHKLQNENYIILIDKSQTITYIIIAIAILISVIKAIEAANM